MSRPTLRCPSRRPRGSSAPSCCRRGRRPDSSTCRWRRSRHRDSGPGSCESRARVGLRDRRESRPGRPSGVDPRRRRPPRSSRSPGSPSPSLWVEERIVISCGGGKPQEAKNSTAYETRCLGQAQAIVGTGVYLGHMHSDNRNFAPDPIAMPTSLAILYNDDIRTKDFLVPLFSKANPETTPHIRTFSRFPVPYAPHRQPIPTPTFTNHPALTAPILCAAAAAAPPQSGRLTAPAAPGAVPLSPLLVLRPVVLLRFRLRGRRLRRLLLLRLLHPLALTKYKYVSLVMKRNMMKNTGS